ncbi:MAG: thiol:disulfide interchange protein DsbD [Cocleimonas sp.]|jgi:thiol:disulfide interchange protein DsbD
MIKKIFASILLFLFAVQAFAVNPDDLLRPDEAFKPTLSQLSDNHIKATWDIADAYYMYRKRFKFESDTPGITLGEAIIPDGKIKDDPGFGRVETYRKQVAIEIPLMRDASASKAITLSVKTVSQGCADAGICYPPQKKTLKIKLDAMKVASAKEDKKTISLANELGLSGLLGSNQPLPPEEAFKVKLKTSDGQLLKANWNVTKGHYLYQDKIKLRIVGPKKGLTISDLDLPPAVKEIDPFFGEMNTYNKNFSVSAKIDASTSADADLLTKDIMVKATYQGCSKLTGICYPPQHDTLKVNFSSGQLIKVAAPAALSSPTQDSMSSNPMAMLKKPNLMMAANDPVADELGGSSSSAVTSSPSIGKSDLASQLGITGLGMVDETLDPDQAFVFDLTATDKQTLNARWDIVKGHYLYQHKFNFEIVDAPAGVSLDEAKLPKGVEENDQYFGDVVIYYDSFDAKVPLVFNGGDSANVDSITVKTSYQGCSKLTGVCYPPQHKIQKVNLASAQDVAAKSGSNSNTAANNNTNADTNATQETAVNSSTNKIVETNTANQKVSEQDGLINKLTNGSFFNSLIIFFLAGLALTFTPCVFPMIPILSGIIAGQGSDNSTKKSFFLSLSYVLAMAVTYSIVGVIAALSGENLQVALQNPWVIGAFAILFILLSLSMFGFYELQMPASVQSKLTNISNSQTGGSMMNAGIMGFLSALIVGPCVTAPLIAALVYIANTKDVVLGGLSLFSLGLGMGVPLLIIGTSAGKILPKAGAWMDSVKAGFGIMMLALGIWMLERILPFSTVVVLTGILTVFTGIYMGALDALNEASTGWKRFFKAAGLVVLIYGVSLLIGAASGNASLLKPLKGFTGGVSQSTAEPQHLVFKQIKGIKGLEDALAMAKQQNQTVMLDFYADWCISCKEMEFITFKDANVIESLKDTLLIQADVTLDDEQDKALNKHFGLFGPPAIIFFDKNGTENKPYRTVGYKGPKEFNDHIQQFKQTLQ